MAYLSSAEFTSIYSKVTRLCVEVIIQTSDGIVLSLRSIEPWKGLWHIPGGTVMYKETLEDAVKRVAKEELGVGVNIKEFVGFLHYPSEEKVRGFGWSIGVAFLCSINSGILRGSVQGEVVKAFNEVPQAMVEEQKDIIQKCLKRQQEIV